MWKWSGGVKLYSDKEARETVKKELEICRRNKIKTGGDCVIELRRKYNLSQADLAGSKINRTLISYIENKKIGLTRKTAEAIVANTNEILVARGIESSIVLSDILVDMHLEVLGIIKSFGEKLHSIFKGKQRLTESFLTEIEEFIFDKDIPYEKAMLYEQMGDLYSINESRDLDKGYIYYMKAFEFYILSDRSQAIESVIVKILVNRFEAKDFNGINRYVTLFLCTLENGSADIKTRKSRDGNRETLGKIYYYWAKTKYAFGDFESAIKLSKVALNYVPHKDLIQKAIVMMDMGLYLQKRGSYSQSLKCLVIAQRRFLENQRFGLYCDSLMLLCDNILGNDALMEDEKISKLDRYVADMLYGIKYFSAETENLYSYYMCLCKIYDAFNKKDELIRYFSLARSSVEGTKNLRSLITFVLEMNGLKNSAELMVVLNEEPLIEMLYSLEQYDTDYKRAMFILIEILVRKNDSEKVVELWERLY